jgi:DNA polymerase-1
MAAGDKILGPDFADAVFLIDVSGFLFKFYYSIRGLSTVRGEPTGAVFGVAKLLQRLVADFAPRYLAVAMDSTTPTFRRERFPAYKANRPPPPEDLKPQFGFVREMVEAFGLPVLQRDGFEADDLIATMVHRLAADRRIVILGSDKDLLQLVSDRVVVLGGADLDEVIGPAEVLEKWGVPPERMVDLQALVGDATDNVPGVPGVGPKTAARLLRGAASLDDLLARPGEVANPRTRRLLETHAEEARRARDLVRLRPDVPLDGSLDDLRYLPPDTERLRAIYRRFDFHSLAAALPKGERSPEEARDYHTVRSEEDLRAAAAAIREAGEVSVDTETTGLDPMRDRLVGISLSCRPGHAWYVPVSHRGAGAGEQLPEARVREVLGPILADPAIGKLGQNAKFDALVLERAGMPIRGLVFDTMLASYLLDPERHQHRLEQIAAQWLGREMITYDEVTEKRRGGQLGFDEVGIEPATRYAAEDAEVVWALAPKLRAALEEAGLLPVLRELELPLSDVLASLERAGVRVDVGRLRALSRELDRETGALADEIRRMAGGDFNLNSPKQLAEILFDRLGLPSVRKTKTGRSTDADVLEELSVLHPLPAKLLQYRSLTRLVSGYLEALPALVNPETGRIHTSYNQAVAATGRLSSSNPNLQNIPVRTEVGRRIREAFVAEPGHRIVSADYSQVELRILAHLSEDPVLVESFRTGEDVHARTAREVFGAITGGSADAELRRRAKAINFGLARELAIPRAQARAFIDDYFARYRGVRVFLDRVVAQARESGEVRTLFGRRRFLPDINSRNPNARSQAERMAMNTPIQGSAADLLKRAMIRVHDAIARGGLRSRMILTVHDELVLESPFDEVRDLKALLREAMEGALDLRVPLVIDVGEGDTWAQAH